MYIIKVMLLYRVRRIHPHDSPIKNKGPSLPPMHYSPIAIVAIAHGLNTPQHQVHMLTMPSFSSRR